MHPRILAITPYFGGAFPGHSDPRGRLGYLERCVGSLKGVAERIVIGLQNDDDERAVRARSLGVEIKRIVEPEPTFLPAQLCRAAVDDLSNYDLVYYTESDQVLEVGNRRLFETVARDEHVYLSPHRLARVPEHLRELTEILGSDSYLARVVERGDAWFAIENEPLEPPSSYDADLYVNADMRTAYGGAFLGSASFFRRIEFTTQAPLPTERTAGFDAFAVPGVRALKTKRIADFCVEHLSGSEFYGRLTAPEFSGGDWRVRHDDGTEITCDGKGRMRISAHPSVGG